MILLFLVSSRALPHCSLHQSDQQCSRCQQGFAIRDGRCYFAACAIGHYWLESECYDCPHHSILCDSSGFALACKIGSRLHNGLCVPCEIGCGSCDGGQCKSCVSGYALRGAACQLCEIQHCQNCTSAQWSCDLCTPGYYFDQKVRQCMPQQYSYLRSDLGCELYSPLYQECIVCKPGTFLSAGRCFSCPSNCLRCSSSQHCLLCDRQVKYEGRCLSTCPPGYHYQSRDNSCRACQRECAICTSATNCLVHAFLLEYQGEVRKCQPGWQLSLSPQQLAKATSLQLGGLIHLSCQKCSPLCQDCAYMKCLRCQQGAYKYKGKCVKDCTPGFVQEGECFPCQPGCHSCHVLGCISCSPLFVISGLQCVFTIESAPAKTFKKNGTCPTNTVDQGENCACHQSCDLCEYQPITQSYVCVRCLNISHVTAKGVCYEKCPRPLLKIYNGICVSQCPPNLFSVQFSCIPSCPEGHIPIGRQCIVLPFQCQGYYLWSEGRASCQSCSTHCLICLHAQHCHRCQLEYYLSYSDRAVLCVKGCLPSQVVSYSGDSCLTCLVKCTTCVPGLVLQGDRCQTQCDRGSEQKNQICVAQEGLLLWVQAPNADNKYSYKFPIEVIVMDGKADLQNRSFTLTAKLTSGRTIVETVSSEFDTVSFYIPRVDLKPGMSLFLEAKMVQPHRQLVNTTAFSLTTDPPSHNSQFNEGLPLTRSSIVVWVNWTQTQFPKLYQVSVLSNRGRLLLLHQVRTELDQFQYQIHSFNTPFMTQPGATIQLVATSFFGTLHTSQFKLSQQSLRPQELWEHQPLTFSEACAQLDSFSLYLSFDKGEFALGGDLQLNTLLNLAHSCPDSCVWWERVASVCLHSCQFSYINSVLPPLQRTVVKWLDQVTKPEISLLSFIRMLPYLPQATARLLVHKTILLPTQPFFSELQADLAFDILDGLLPFAGDKLAAVLGRLAETAEQISHSMQFSSYEYSGATVSIKIYKSDYLSHQKHKVIELKGLKLQFVADNMPWDISDFRYTVVIRVDKAVRKNTVSDLVSAFKVDLMTKSRHPCRVIARYQFPLLLGSVLSKCRLKLEEIGLSARMPQFIGSMSQAGSQFILQADLNLNSDFLHLALHPLDDDESELLVLGLCILQLAVLALLSKIAGGRLRGSSLSVNYYGFSDQKEQSSASQSQYQLQMATAQALDQQQHKQQRVGPTFEFILMQLGSSLSIYILRSQPLTRYYYEPLKLQQALLAVLFAVMVSLLVPLLAGAAFRAVSRKVNDRVKAGKAGLMVQGVMAAGACISMWRIWGQFNSQPTHIAFYMVLLPTLLMMLKEFLQGRLLQDSLLVGILRPFQ